MEKNQNIASDAPSMVGGPAVMSQREGAAITAIREHNSGCDAACAAQRPNERQSGGCGYQKHDGSFIYGRNCPTCPKDWKIDFPQ